MSSTRQVRPIFIVAGTRPEVIKQAPVYFRARERLGAEHVHWVSTGQHNELEIETLRSFGIEVTHHLRAGDTEGSLLTVHERIICALGELQRRVEPGLVVVQGDTLSTFSAAFAAFHGGVPVAHVEAGLRTHDIDDPFPEEAYRRMISVLATVHFAPTSRAADNLVRESCAAGSIYITGNTAVDALALVDQVAARSPAPNLPVMGANERLLFATMHRRESWGQPLLDMCMALRDIAERFQDVRIVVPMHTHPTVASLVQTTLGAQPHITLVPPLDFAACHHLIRASHLILTDSGGIQEEAPSYGVPVIVLRRTTERPETLEHGMAVLAGTDRTTIVQAATRILEQRGVRRGLLGEHVNPFGDGRAAERIALALERFSRHQHPLLTSKEEYKEPPHGSSGERGNGHHLQIVPAA